MDRPTQTFRIGSPPKVYEFVVKTYATAREAQAIQQAYFRGAKIEVAGDQPRIADFNPAVQFDVQQEMIRQTVVSLDGDAENVAERCLDLPTEIYNDLVSKLDE